MERTGGGMIALSARRLASLALPVDLVKDVDGWLGKYRDYGFLQKATGNAAEDLSGCGSLMKLTSIPSFGRALPAFHTSGYAVVCLAHKTGFPGVAAGESAAIAAVPVRLALP